MRKLTFILLLIGLGTILNAQEKLSSFQQANQLYEVGKYDSAVIAYENLLTQDIISDDLHFNLGNAYFKNNQIALAILHYEKALKVNPANEDAAFNLAIASEKTIDKIESIPDLFIYRWWKSIYNLLSMDQWATLVPIFLLFSLIGLAIYWISSNLAFRKFGFYTAVAAIVVAVLAWFMASNQSKQLNNVQYAIITSPTVNINSSPSEGSSKLFVLHEGTKVKVKESKDNWYRVSLPNGNEGWIEQALLADI